MHVHIECETDQEYNLVDGIVNKIDLNNTWDRESTAVYLDFKEQLEALPGFRIENEDIQPTYCDREQVFFIRVFYGFGEWLAADIPCRYSR